PEVPEKVTETDAFLPVDETGEDRAPVDLDAETPVETAQAAEDPAPAETAADAPPSAPIPATRAETAPEEAEAEAVTADAVDRTEQDAETAAASATETAEPIDLPDTAPSEADADVATAPSDPTATSETISEAPIPDPRAALFIAETLAPALPADDGGNDDVRAPAWAPLPIANPARG
ncbi:MAG: hypothetical protein AAFT19_02710, partial [Pseudomonadota bacterium]